MLKTLKIDDIHLESFVQNDGNDSFKTGSIDHSLTEYRTGEF
jgi:hypothetical protein